MDELAFRPERLILRRSMLGISQQELAVRSGISQPVISKIEQHLRVAPPEVVERLAAALDCPISFFGQAEREYGAPLSAHPMFRKSASVGQKVLDQVLAELNVRIGHLRTLLSAMDYRAELPLPQYEAEDYGGDMEAVADNVRRAWYMPRGPVASLVEYVERAGCIVAFSEMEAARIDGISYRIPGLPPVIFLNIHQPADRMRFSLAHELGHLVLHRYPEPEMERQANEFASALLMPKADIAPLLADLSLEKVAQMKPAWRVSMAALLKRAEALGRVDRTRATYLWRQMSQRGYRLREPAALDFAAERPVLVDAMLAHMTDQLRYSPEELERVLHLKYEEIAQLYRLAAPSRLRRVK